MKILFTDDSDEPEGLVRHIPRRLLGSRAHSRKRKRANIGNRTGRLEADSDSEDEPAAARPLPGQWTPRDPGLLGSKVKII